jgi:hypothetical protein
MRVAPPISSETVRDLERVEMDGWVDLYAAPTADLRGRGIAHEAIDDGALLIWPNLWRAQS